MSSSVQSRLTKTLAVITKKLKWPENKSFGYEGPDRRDKYMNPLLTPPPRSPRSPEDFRYPERLGHWKSHGYDYTSQVQDKYMFNEMMFICCTVGVVATLFYAYGPDYRLYDWSKREAYLRTHKREALGLPVIDRNVVDPARVVLPTEEELKDFEPVTW